MSSIVIGRDQAGNCIAYEVDGRPIEVDASARAEAAIGGASGSAATSAAGAVTLNNATAGTITTETLATAVGASYTLTLTSNLIKASSLVFASVWLPPATTHGTACITHVTPASGSVVITVKNIDATNAFNGSIKIGFAIFQ